MDTTITATEDSMVHKEVVAMEATEEVVAVVAVEAVVVATTIPSNKEMTSKTMKKTMLVGDRVVLLITATQTTHLTVVVVEAETRTLGTEDLEEDSRVLTATDPETTTSRKTLAFHAEGLLLNTKQKVEAILSHQQVAL